jgi:flagellar biosynthetic protein FliO
MNILTSMKKWLESASQKQKLTAVLLGFSLLSTIALFAMNGSSEPAADPLNSTPFYFLGVFVKLIGVLLLIVASAVIFRRWFQPGFHGKTTRRLLLLETVRLSPKQALHLVSIGDQQLLIGATDQHVSLITSIEQNLNMPEESMSTPSVLDFGSVLQNLNVPSLTDASKE